MTSKLVPSNPEEVMVIREVVPNVTTLSVPFLRFGRIKVGGRATVGTSLPLSPLLNLTNAPSKTPQRLLRSLLARRPNPQRPKNPRHLPSNLPHRPRP